MAGININKVSAAIAIVAIIFIFPLSFSYGQAQTGIAFTPTDHFSIPAYNGSISFAVKGTYSKATFENNSWVFTNLNLTNLQTNSQPLENLKISTQNSNITILSCLTSNNTSFQSERLRYVVEGQGKQIVNLGLGPKSGDPSLSFEWIVSANNHTFFAEGDVWSLSHDGTITVNGASGNVSITHYDFADFGNGISNSNSPFYQQHSVAIVTVIAVAIVVVIAVVIKVKNKEQPSGIGKI